MIADHRRNLGRVWKIETLPILRICPRSFQLRFRIFISRQNLGRSGNSKIPDHLGFSRHMKTRLYVLKWIPSLTSVVGWLVGWPISRKHFFVILLASGFVVELTLHRSQVLLSLTLESLQATSTTPHSCIESMKTFVMAGETEESPDWLGLAHENKPLLKREALSKIKLPLSLLSLLTLFE